MFWFSEPITIVCDAVVAAVKFVVCAEFASITHEPVARKVTTPPLIEHLVDEPAGIVKTGERPEALLVTVLVDVPVGV